MRILNPFWERWFMSLLAWLGDGYWPERHGEDLAALASDLLAEMDEAHQARRPGRLHSVLAEREG